MHTKMKEEEIQKMATTIKELESQLASKMSISFEDSKKS